MSLDLISEHVARAPSGDLQTSKIGLIFETILKVFDVLQLYKKEVIQLFLNIFALQRGRLSWKFRSPWNHAFWKF